MGLLLLVVLSHPLVNKNRRSLLVDDLKSASLSWLHSPFTPSGIVVLFLVVDDLKSVLGIRRRDIILSPMSATSSGSQKLL